VEDRKLVINQAEADTVRHIFRRYAIVKSVRALKEELDDHGVVSKTRVDRYGRDTGAKPLARGALYEMLQNPIYRGQIRHKDKSYPGLHKAIIEEALWDEVQAALAENRVERVARAQATAPSLLAGLIYDDSAERMSPTHAVKKGTRYRYYVSQSLIKRDRPKASTAACRVPAADLETLVEDRIIALLQDEAALNEAADRPSIDVRKALIAQARNLASRWPSLAAPEKRTLLHALVARIDVRAETVDITVSLAALPAIVQPDLDLRRLPLLVDTPTRTLSIPAKVKRTDDPRRMLPQHRLELVLEAFKVRLGGRRRCGHRQGVPGSEGFRHIP
jgi:site-specific DNA recombinase